MDRDDKQVAADLADAALGVWEVSRKILIHPRPDRFLLADDLDGRAAALAELARELRA